MEETFFVYVIEYEEKPGFYFNIDTGFYERGFNKASLFMELNNALDAIFNYKLNETGMIAAYELKRV